MYDGSGGGGVTRVLASGSRIRLHESIIDNNKSISQIDCCRVVCLKEKEEKK